MVSAIAIVTALMLGFIAWSTAFRLRYDRIMAERELTRGKFAFRPRERARLLLRRSFPVAAGKPRWEDPLISNLRAVPTEAGTRDAGGELGAAPRSSEEQA